MRIRLLDLDGSLTGQRRLVRRHAPDVVPLSDWGPHIRMGCSFPRFRRFEEELSRRLGAEGGAGPWLRLYGSGDFHHVSLALVRRLATPFNLLVLDKHPDWMRAIPFLHCGTWLYHAARLPMAQGIYHVGGDLDFDNAFRWLAPWKQLSAGKIVVFPAVRRYERGPWRRLPHTPLRERVPTPTTAERLEQILAPYAGDLARWPLYVSLDKDVLVSTQAVVNWDSGHLRLPEVMAVLRAFVDAAQGRLAGKDIVGDWSPVRHGGQLRRVLHWTEHPTLAVDPAEACRRNERTNLVLLRSVSLLARPAGRALGSSAAARGG
jgi:hypothetical protein